MKQDSRRRHRWPWLKLGCAGLAWALSATLSAAVFTVDSLGDFNDDDPGDGHCETILGNPIDGFQLRCSLRGAIEEANALAGEDEIRFSVAGTIAPSMGPLPAIVGVVVLDGASAPGAPGRDKSLGVVVATPAPRIFVSGDDLSVGADGLQLSASASGSQIYNIGVIHFAGDGMRIDLGATGTIAETVISGNWIGLAADRSAAANGTGVVLLSGGGLHKLRIGHDGSELAGTGRGNVIAGNLGAGIAGSISGITLRGNWIGSAGDGLLGDPGASPTMVPNGLSGVALTGDGNQIIDNQLLANGDPQIRLQGNDVIVRANQVYGRALSDVDLTDLDSVVAGGSDGMHIIGSRSVIRNNNVWVNQFGIVLDTATVAETGAEVVNNDVILNARDGIDLRGVNAIVMERNNLQLNGGFGANIATEDNLIRGNRIGVAISANEGLGNALGGLRIAGANNDVVEAPGDIAQPAEGNLIVGNDGPGILVTADGVLIEDNNVSLNTGAGIRVESARATVMNANFIVGNRALAPSGSGYGVVLMGDTAASQIEGNIFIRNAGAAVALAISAGVGNSVLGNFWVGNSGISIDLGQDGATLNDAADADEGPNRLQNYPQLGNLVFNAEASPPTLRLAFQVDSDGSRSSLPLSIEFYLSDGAFERGGTPINGPGRSNPAVSYSPPATTIVTLELPPGTGGGSVRAVATDDNGNSSEFSPAHEFGQIDDSLFADGFEPGPCRDVCPITDPDCVLCRTELLFLPWYREGGARPGQVLNWFDRTQPDILD